MNDLTLKANQNKFQLRFCGNNTAQNPFSTANTSSYWLNNNAKSVEQNGDSFVKQNYTPTNKKSLDIDADSATNATGTAVMLRGIQWLIEKVSGMFSGLLMAGKEFASEADVRKVADAMKSENGLKADIHYIDNANKGALKRMFPGLAKDLDVVANGANAFYTHQGNFAVAPKSKPSLILHELGHATNFEKSKFFGGLQKLRVLGMYAPMALAFLNDITGKRKDGKESFIERNAGIIGFSAFLPTIIEEGAASIRGIKAAKKTLPKVKLGALKRNYFFAWMTYVLAGVGIGVASKLAICERKINPKNTQEQAQN